MLDKIKSPQLLAFNITIENEGISKRLSVFFSSHCNDSDMVGIVVVLYLRHIVYVVLA